MPRRALGSTSAMLAARTLMPLTSTAALDARSLPALAASLLRDCSGLFQGLDLILHLRDARGQIGRRAQHARDLRQQRVLVLHPGERIVASNGFDAAHASGHAALGHDLEQADVAGAGHVGAAAEFAREADIQHAHGVAVFPNSAMAPPLTASS